MPFAQFLIFFMLLITGFFCKKYRMLTDTAVNAINKFIIVIGYPCLILARLTALDMDRAIFINFLLSLLISVGLLMLFAAYARLYCSGKRFPGEDRPVAESAIIYSNNTFMGFPIVITFYGDLGLLYMISANIAMNVVLFSYGITIFKRGQKTQDESASKKLQRLIKTMVHPGIIAAAAGIVLCYNRIELPGFLWDYLDIVGSVVVPMAIISIGTMLAGGFGLNSFKKKLVMEPVLNRLLVAPIITAIVVWFLPLDPLVKIILIVSHVLPVAVMVPMFEEQYGRNKGYAVELVVVSTILSMVTIPFAIWILQSI